MTRTHGDAESAVENPHFSKRHQTASSVRASRFEKKISLRRVYTLYIISKKVKEIKTKLPPLPSEEGSIFLPGGETQLALSSLKVFLLLFGI